MKHPCALWAGARGGNYAWLWTLAMELCHEFTKRYGKEHASQKVIEGPLRVLPGTLTVTLHERTPFAQCMPEQYKTEDAVLAYRLYYVGEKMRFAKWTHGAVPPYWIDEVRYRAETLRGVSDDAEMVP